MIKHPTEILLDFEPIFYEDAPMSTDVAYKRDDVIEAMKQHANDKARHFAQWLSEQVFEGRTMTKLWIDYQAEYDVL